MSDVFHYDDSALPVGNPINLNGRDGCYSLGLFDGGVHGEEQYPDEPLASVNFESPEGAKAWLEAAIEVLTPYIESGNDERRIPNPDGWEPIP